MTSQTIYTVTVVDTNNDSHQYTVKAGSVVEAKETASLMVTRDIPQGARVVDVLVRDNRTS